MSLQLNDHSWPAHQYILLSRSDYFHKLLADARKSSKGDKLVIQIQDIHPDIFEQLLYYIYTDSCDLITVGAKFEFSAIERTVDECGDREFMENDWAQIKSKSAYEVVKSQKKGGSKGSKKGHGRDDNPVELLKDTARKFGIKSLARK